jgi:hypothetical protein
MHKAAEMPRHRVGASWVKIWARSTRPAARVVDSLDTNSRLLTKSACGTGETSMTKTIDTKTPTTPANPVTASDGREVAVRNGSEVASLPAIANDAEAAAVRAYFAKGASKAPLARTKVETRAGVAHLAFDHASQAVGLALLANTFCTGSAQFATGLLGQLVDVSRTGREPKASELDYMIATVQSIAPKDEIEALLASQMAAIHNATMSAARRLNQADTTLERDSASNALNKLARTFAAQLEALKRYRSDGEQAPTVKVQRVTVHDGGQAIVGNIQHGGNHEAKTKTLSNQPCGALAQGTPLLGHVETIPAALPGAGRAGQESLPVPRRSRRRTQRSG